MLGALLLTFATAALCGVCPQGQWQFNGHTYRFTTRAMTFGQAVQEAEVVFDGYLVEIETYEEQKFIENTILGGSLDRLACWGGATDRQVEGQWRWLNNEPITYSHWFKNEPNDYGRGGEDAMVINWHHSRNARKEKGDWNDMPDGSKYFGLIEMDGERDVRGGCDCRDCAGQLKSEGQCGFPSCDIETGKCKSFPMTGFACDDNNKNTIDDYCHEDGTCAGELATWMCLAVGDPHYFDSRLGGTGKWHDHMALGDYLLGSADGVEVHAHAYECAPKKKGHVITCNDQLTLNAGSNVVTLDLKEFALKVNGKQPALPLTLSTTPPLRIENAVQKSKIRFAGGVGMGRPAYRFSWGDDRILAWWFPWRGGKSPFLNIQWYRVPSSGPPVSPGLCGGGLMSYEAFPDCSQAECCDAKFVSQAKSCCKALYDDNDVEGKGGGLYEACLIDTCNSAPDFECEKGSYEEIAEDTGLADCVPNKDCTIHPFPSTLNQDWELVYKIHSGSTEGGLPCDLWQNSQTLNEGDKEAMSIAPTATKNFKSSVVRDWPNDIQKVKVAFYKDNKERSFMEFDASDSKTNLAWFTKKNIIASSFNDIIKEKQNDFKIDGSNNRCFLTTTTSTGSCGKYSGWTAISSNTNPCSWESGAKPKLMYQETEGGKMSTAQEADNFAVYVTRSLPGGNIPCHTGTCDVMLVVDRSLSIRNQEPDERQFILDLMNSLFHHYADLRVGIVTFAKQATLDSSLTGDEQALANIVNNWPGLAWGTYTYKGIQIARDQLTRNARTACKRMYVITDGKSHKESKTYSEADKTHLESIQVVAVGVGPKIDKKELNKIASDPVADNLILADNFKQADKMITEHDKCLQNAECDTRPANLEGGEWSCTTPVAHGGTCSFNCHSGSTAGDGTATCLNGVWDGYDDEVCTNPPCNTIPADPTNGRWGNCTAPVASGDSCSLQCNVDIQNGDGVVTCHEGQWTGTGDTCQDPKCPSGSWSYQGSRYKFTELHGSWSEAATEAQNQGGFLAVLNSFEEMNYVKESILTGDRANQAYWIGLFSKTNQFSWMTKAPVTYTNWQDPTLAVPASDHYAAMNQEYTLTGVEAHKGQWSTEANNGEKMCGLIEIPPTQNCVCRTALPPDPTTCAPDPCSTLISKNNWNLVMCDFQFNTEFGQEWAETENNHFQSSLNAGWDCSPADSATAALCP